MAVTHPNDLVEGDTATFRFLDNGKPAAGYAATVILDGLRYRSELGEIRLNTDQNGEIQVKWPAAGMYWVNIAPPRAPGMGGPGGPGGPGPGGECIIMSFPNSVYVSINSNSNVDDNTQHVASPAKLVQAYDNAWD